MMAEVEIQTKRQNLETERINAEITVTQAKAQADSALAKAQAEAEAIRVRGIAEADAIKARGEALRQNAQLIALTQAEKWDGVLPTTMIPGGAVPFLNLNPIPIPSDARTPVQAACERTAWAQAFIRYRQLAGLHGPGPGQHGDSAGR
jgi:hypothetical protein